MKTVSIIMPCYNRLPQLKEAVMSVRDITNNAVPYELICVDDGCDAETARWLRSAYAAHVIDWLIVHERNEGIPCSINDGWHAATGSYLMRFNADIAVNRADWLQRLVGAIKAFHQLGLLGIPVNSKFSGCGWLDNGTSRVRLITGGVISGEACIMRRKMLNSPGYLWPFRHPYGYDDIEYSKRVEASGFLKIGYLIEEPRLLVRCHQEWSEQYRDYNLQKKASLDANEAEYRQRKSQIQRHENLYVPHHNEVN